MKKKIQVLWISLLMMFVAAIVQSCCTNEYTYTGGSILSFNHLDEAWIHDHDTIRSNFSVVAQANIEIAWISNNAQFIPSAMATTCAEIYRNEIDTSSMSLFIDQEIVFNGNTIPPQTNLIDLEGVLIGDIYHGYIQFFFTEDFMTKAEIPDGQYLFALNGKTDDGIPIDSEAYFQIKIN